jgi:hypothetical protein
VNNKITIQTLVEKLKKIHPNLVEFKYDIFGEIGLVLQVNGKEDHVWISDLEPRSESRKILEDICQLIHGDKSEFYFAE